MEREGSVPDPGRFNHLVMVEGILQFEFHPILDTLDRSFDSAVFGLGLTGAEAHNKPKA